MKLDLTNRAFVTFNTCDEFKLTHLPLVIIHLARGVDMKH